MLKIRYLNIFFIQMDTLAIVNNAAVNYGVHAAF